MQNRFPRKVSYLLLLPLQSKQRLPINMEAGGGRWRGKEKQKGAGIKRNESE
jgi:hypothetical protein